MQTIAPMRQTSRPCINFDIDTKVKWRLWQSGHWKSSEIFSTRRREPARKPGGYQEISPPKTSENSSILQWKGTWRRLLHPMSRAQRVKRPSIKTLWILEVYTTYHAMTSSTISRSLPPMEMVECSIHSTFFLVLKQLTWCGTGNTYSECASLKHMRFSAISRQEAPALCWDIPRHGHVQSFSIGTY